MKNVLATTLVILASTAALAAPGKAREAMTREKAVEYTSRMEKTGDKSYYKNLSTHVAKSLKIEGVEAKIERALTHGSEDMLMTVYEAAEKGKKEQIEYIADIAGGIKSKEDAQIAAVVSDLPTTGSQATFKAEFKSQIEKGETIETAVKLSAKKIGREKEITLEALKKLCGKA